MYRAELKWSSVMIELEFNKGLGCLAVLFVGMRKRGLFSFLFLPHLAFRRQHCVGVKGSEVFKAFGASWLYILEYYTATF